MNAKGRGSIIKTGVSKFALRITSDVDNIEPTWAGAKTGQILPLPVETSGTSKDPKLVVTYTKPTTITVSEKVSVASADDCPAGYVSEANKKGTDIDDNPNSALQLASGKVWQYLACYIDADGDGRAAKISTDPGTTNLAGHWKMDDGGSTTAVLQPGSEGYEAYLQSAGNNGGGQATTITIGAAGYGSVVRNVLKFDLSSIPSGATITDAKLDLFENHRSGLGAGSNWVAQGKTTYDINMYKLRRNWVEGTTEAAPDGADWSTYDGTSTWSTVGAEHTSNDRYSTSSASITIDPRNGQSSNSNAACNCFVTYTSATFLQDIKDFVSGAKPNYGWLMKASHEGHSEGGGYATVTYRSSDYSVASERPKLTVTYVEGTSDSSSNSNTGTLENMGMTPFTVTWRNTAGVTVTGSTIDKIVGNGWSNSYVESEEQILSGDGYFEFKMYNSPSGGSNPQDHGRCGFHTTTDQGIVGEALHRGMGWATYSPNAALGVIRESGQIFTSNYPASSVTNTVLKVAIEGGLVNFYVNGNLHYASGLTVTYPVRFVCGLYDNDLRVEIVSTAKQSFGATSVDGGKIGKALSFDGVDDYVNVPASDSLPDSSKSSTAGAWFKTSETGTHQPIIARDNGGEAGTDGWMIRVRSDNKLAAHILNTAASEYASVNGVGSVVTDGIWHHMALVWDNEAAMIMYLDGVEIGRDTAFAGTKAGTDPNLWIGKGTDNNWFFNGLIDDVRIYNKVLTADEIESLTDPGTKKMVGAGDGCPSGYKPASLGADCDDSTNSILSCTLRCADGVKNGDETEVDCGGSCAACSVPIDPIPWVVTNNVEVSGNRVIHSSNCDQTYTAWADSEPIVDGTDMSFEWIAVAGAGVSSSDVTFGFSKEDPSTNNDRQVFGWYTNINHNNCYPLSAQHGWSHPMCGSIDYERRFKLEVKDGTFNYYIDDALVDSHPNTLGWPFRIRYRWSDIEPVCGNYVELVGRT